MKKLQQKSKLKKVYSKKDWTTRSSNEIPSWLRVSKNLDIIFMLA